MTRLMIFGNSHTFVPLPAHVRAGTRVRRTRKDFRVSVLAYVLGPAMPDGPPQRTVALRRSHTISLNPCGQPLRQDIKRIWSDETANPSGYNATGDAPAPGALPETGTKGRLRNAVGRALLFARVSSMPDIKLDHRGRVSNYRVIGQPWSEYLDFFHALMHRSIASLLLFMLCLYTLLAVIFACLYWIEPGSIRNMVSSSAVDSFDDAMYFSVQTLSTIGYGSLIPSSHFAHALALVESFAGLAFAALFAGVFFAKLSAPKARVAFTKFAVTQTVDGKQVLMLRVCNQRDTQIVKAQAQACVLMKETTAEGQTAYAYKEMTLNQPSIPVFTAGWRLIHIIDEASPLQGLTAVNARELGIVAIHAVVSGVEEVYGQHIFERHTFLAEHIKFNHTFVRMFEEVTMSRHASSDRQSGKETQLRFHLDRIHQIEKFEPHSGLHELTKQAKAAAQQQREAEASLQHKADELIGRMYRRKSTQDRKSQATAPSLHEVNALRPEQSAPARSSNARASDRLSSSLQAADNRRTPVDQNGRLSATNGTNGTARAAIGMASSVDQLDV